MFALAGLASGATLSLPDQSDFTWVAGSNASGIGTGATATLIQTWAECGAVAGADGASVEELVGWFGGTGQGYDQASYGNDISVTGTDSFYFKSRPALSGEYMIMGVALTEDISSVTLSFSNDKKLGYSLWAYDTETNTATELVANTFSADGSEVTATYDTAEVSSENTVLLAHWTANHPNGNAGGGANVNVTGISLSYTSVPEPATASLSLLGLAALMIRRRR